VRLVDQVSERVEGWRIVRIFGGRFERMQIIGVASAPDLREDCVAFCKSDLAHHLVDLGRRLESPMEGVRPESAVLLGKSGRSRANDEESPAHASVCDFHARRTMVSIWQDGSRSWQPKASRI